MSIGGGFAPRVPVGMGKMLFHSMGNMFSYLTNGATLNQNESAINKCNYRGFSFAQSGNNYDGFEFLLPQNWDQRYLTCLIAWTSAATSGNLALNVQAIVRRNGDTFDQAFGTAFTINSPAPASAYNKVITPEFGPIWPGGNIGLPATCEIRLSRNGGGPGDTLPGTAVITSCSIYGWTTGGQP
jgi:hypothetical protein